MECWKGIASALGAAIVLSACLPPAMRSAAAPAVEAVIPARTSDDDSGGGADLLEQLIVYAERARRLPPLGLEADYVAVREAYRLAPDSFTRLKLAVLVSAPRVPFRDDEWARELLHAAAQDANAAGTTRALAALWLRELEERIALERALEDERRQRQALQRKLEQLKTIEEEIDRRQAPAVVPSQ